MAFWNRSSRATRETAMKTIVHRGGVITFRIPSHWREEYSDMEGATFYDDRQDAGTLRLKLTLMRAPDAVRRDSGIDVLRGPIDQLTNTGVKVRTRNRKDGNASLSYEDSAIEEGTPLTISYWVVANPLPPRHVRIANFSYTVLARLRNDPTVKSELEMLEAEIEAATFAPQVGVTSE